MTGMSPVPEALGFAGPQVISGAAASIGHRARPANRELPFRDEAAAGGGKYSIERDIAQLFAKARSMHSARPKTQDAGTKGHGWMTVEYDLRPQLDPIVAELGRMPTSTSWRSEHALTSALLFVDLGGAKAVARALDIPQAGTAGWQSIDDLRRHLDPIVEKLGRMPAQAELRERSRQELVGAIHKHGGHRRVAEVLGYPYTGLPRWSSVEDIRSELDPIVAEIGVMPDRRELASRGRVDLASAIAKFGGFTSVAEALGYAH